MDKLYYISQGLTPEAHLYNIKEVCLSGGKLIQLRLKNTSQEVYNEVALKAKRICTEFHATLIINDNVISAQYADGIHVGKHDQRPSEIRSILTDKLIGGTANTLNECLELIKQGVDYIGLGPFQFTTTKKNLDPVLGLDGYREIIQSLNTLGHSTPVYAIGGIEMKDLAAIYKTGVYGIAVSGLLTQKKNLKERINEIQQVL